MIFKRGQFDLNPTWEIVFENYYVYFKGWALTTNQEVIAQLRHHKENADLYSSGKPYSKINVSSSNKDQMNKDNVSEEQ